MDEKKMWLVQTKINKDMMEKKIWWRNFSNVYNKNEFFLLNLYGLDIFSLFSNINLAL